MFNFGTPPDYYISDKDTHKSLYKELQSADLPRFPFIWTDIAQLDAKLQDNTYDFIYLSNVLDYVSDDIKSYLIDNYGVPAQNIRVTINGIDSKKFSKDNYSEEIIEELFKDLYEWAVSNGETKGYAEYVEATKASIAAYSDTVECQRAVVRGIMGQLDFQGKLPVKLQKLD